MRYEDLLKLLLDAGKGNPTNRVRVDLPMKNTYIMFASDRFDAIEVWVAGDMILRVFEDGWCCLGQGQEMTRTVQSRLNTILGEHNYRVVKRSKVYYLIYPDGIPLAVSRYHMFLIPLQKRGRHGDSHVY